MDSPMTSSQSHLPEPCSGLLAVELFVTCNLQMILCDLGVISHWQGYECIAGAPLRLMPDRVRCATLRMLQM